MSRKNKKLLIINSGYIEARKILYEKIVDEFDVSFLFVTGINKELMSKKIRNKSNFLDFEGKRIPEIGIKGTLRLFFKIRKVLLIEKPDFILTSTHHPIHSKIAFLFSRIYKIKFIVWSETWRENPNFSFIMDLYHVFSKYVLKNADANLVHGTTQKEYCMKLGIPEEKIFVFHIQSRDFKDIVTKNKIRKDKEKVILFVGRLNKQKGIFYLLKSFKRIENEIKNSELWLVGEGRDEEYFKELTNELELKNVKFYGHIKTRDLANFYKAADVFVLPSYIYKGIIEGWGLVLNEAASMGLPIISTDAVGARKDLVKDGENGFIIKNGDEFELYKSIKKILLDDEMRKRMSKKSRKIFEKFNDVNKSVEALRKAIEYSDRIS